tara:strand:+ start:509 stop:688 length:180 start_codon:yes stop_codon:yes gene_type:complete
MSKIDPYVAYENSTINKKKKKEYDELNASSLGLWAGCKKLLAQKEAKKKAAELIKGEDF